MNTAMLAPPACRGGEAAGRARTRRSSLMSGVPLLLLVAVLAAGCNIGARPSAVWSPDGKRIALEAHGSLYTFDTGRRTFCRLASGPQTAFNPVWSPDGRRIACFAARIGKNHADPPALLLLDARSGARKVLVPGIGAHSDYNEDDMGAALSLYLYKAGTSQAWSADGSRVLYAMSGEADAALASVAAAGGKPRRLTSGPWSAQNIAWSPDARRIAYFREGELRMLDAGATAARRLWTLPPETRQCDLSSVPQWALDGRSLGVFVSAGKYTETDNSKSYEEGLCQAWVVPVGGSAPVKLAELREKEGLACFSPDLRSIAFLAGLSGEDAAVKLLTPPSQEARTLFQIELKRPEPSGEKGEEAAQRDSLLNLGLPAFSPDGRTLGMVVQPPGEPARLYLAALDGSPPRLFTVTKQ